MDFFIFDPSRNKKFTKLFESNQQEKTYIYRCVDGTDLNLEDSDKVLHCLVCQNSPLHGICRKKNCKYHFYIRNMTNYEGKK